MKYKRFLQQLSFSFLKLCASVPLCLCASLPGAKRREGFTLIELMLVVVIIGVLLAVIVPRAWRANIDTKYATLRQTCVQLAGYANDWAERQLETQPVDADSVLADYLNSLAGVDDNETSGDAWIAVNGASNWNDNNSGLINVDKREDDSGSQVDVTSIVKDLVPTAPPLRNPFTGLEVFRPGNAPSGTNPVPAGAIACAYQRDDGQNYYALIFRSASNTGEYYAGMGDSNLAGLRNGIFINRLMPR